MFEQLNKKNSTLRNTIALGAALLATATNIFLAKPDRVNAQEPPWHVVCREGGTEVEHIENTLPVTFNGDVIRWGQEACTVYTGDPTNFIKAWIDQATGVPPTPTIPQGTETPPTNNENITITYKFDNCPTNGDCQTVQEAVRSALNLWSSWIEQYTSSSVIFVEDPNGTLDIEWNHNHPNFNGCTSNDLWGYYYPYSDSMWMNDNCSWRAGASINEVAKNPMAIALHEEGHSTDFFFNFPNYGHVSDSNAVMHRGLYGAYGAAANRYPNATDISMLRMRFGSN